MKLPKLPKIKVVRGEEAEAAGPAVDGAGTAAAGSILRGYGPLAAFGVLFILMAGFVPSIDDRADETGFVATPTDPGDSPTGAKKVKKGQVASEGPTASGSGSSGVTGDQATGSGDGDAAPAPPLAGRGKGSCAGRKLQVPGNPYSPPCMEYDGSGNGGATYRGVDDDSIVVDVRLVKERGFQQTLAALAGAEIIDTTEDVKRTITALAEFFNQHYQFWGRKMEINFYENPHGSNIEELQGRGIGEAQADAEHVAEKVKAFAELGGNTEPFINALYEKKVVAMGTPYLSRGWHNERRPYAWSFFTDCSIVAEVAAEVYYKMLAGKKAVFAGDALKDRNRKVAGLAPTNQWYQECQGQFIQILKDRGIGSFKANYVLDINSMSNQAASVVSQLINADITTVLCGCDPIFPVFLTAKAAEQNFEPEWVHIGTAFTDIDIVGQLYEQSQWRHAFGVSALGSPRPIRAGLGYSAYKSVRGDEPAFAVEPIFGTMLILATGFQMAGKTLTPETFEQGLFNWPGGSGPYGNWGFGPGNYTPTRDYRVTYWNPAAISIENNKEGAYIEAFDGKRFPPGSLPSFGKGQQPPVIHLDPNYQG